jgi:MYXO-CTERM domain-containing protein
MESRTLIRGAFFAGLIAAAGGFGCSVAASEDTGSSPDQVVSNADTSALLKSTLVLEGGCTAAKVGPKHLLVSARCVTGNPALAAGQVLTFVSAASGQTLPQQALVAPQDAGPPKDSGASDASHATDAAGHSASSASSRDVTITSVEIHSSYTSKCKATASNPDVCGFNTLDASDAADIALIILSSELESVPTVPVDLDPVGQADPLLVVTAGCASVEGAATTAPRTVRTIAVPPQSANHKGSAYQISPQSVARLGQSYVLTAGAGWHANEPRFCATDIGAPLFRGGAIAVAGVTANYTTFADSKLPVTTHHTRVDAQSRFKIGPWLESLGALTIHTCSETSAGCAKHTYDGGTPSGPTGEGSSTTSPGDSGTGPIIAPDASSDGGADPVDNGPHQDQLPSEDPSTATTGESEPDYADAAAPKKKKSAAKGGCSAAPGDPAPTGELFLGFGLALGALVIRRRRSS